MKEKKIVKLLIVYKSGLTQVISMVIKGKNDLERFKQLKFINVINIKEVD